MKKHILLFTAMACVFTTFAQIPNFSFENWTNKGSYDVPDMWGTMNNTTASASVYTTTKATPGNPGSYFLKLTSKTVGPGVVNGIAVSGKLDSITLQPKSGFAFNQQPASFSGKWQHMIYGSSQGSISVTLTRWNTSNSTRETIATANQTLSGMAMSWANFSINFTYQSSNIPDTCIIVLKASGANPTNNDYLWVDNLAFSGTVLGIANDQDVVSNISIFPNPSSSTMNVTMNILQQENVAIQLLDLSGKVIKEKNVGTMQGASKQSLDISGIAKGSYFIRIIAGSATEVKKVIIE